MWVEVESGEFVNVSRIQFFHEAGELVARVWLETGRWVRVSGDRARSLHGKITTQALRVAELGAREAPPPT